MELTQGCFRFSPCSGKLKGRALLEVSWCGSPFEAESAFLYPKADEAAVGLAPRGVIWAFSDIHHTSNARRCLKSISQLVDGLGSLYLCLDTHITYVYMYIYI